MKALLTGARGMLARALIARKPAGCELEAFGKDLLDMTSRTAVEAAILRIRPEIIINCAGFTQVDECETKRELAFSVNGIGAGSLAEGAERAGARLVHFSTDYIFDGTKRQPYEEDNPAHPLNVYGASKWEGECRIREKASRHLIIRAQWLYGNGGNHFVKAILNSAQTHETLRVVNDQIGSPTWTEDLAEATWTLIEKGSSGIYHLANRGECSRYEFACRILQEAGIRREIIPCTSADLPRKAMRPGYSALSARKAEAALGRFLPSWESALKRFFGRSDDV